MKEIGLEELKVLQLDVLQAIHDFCQKKGITYSLACGSALGAVRHKGYIPWDDDIDIYLLRDDYERLMKEYPMNGRYQLISMERDKEWDRPYAKAYDDATIFEEKFNCARIIGIGIDVYPIDQVPDEESDWLRFDKKRRFLQKLITIKQIKFNLSRGFAKNCFLVVTKTLLLPYSRKVLSRCIDKYIKQFNANDCEWVFESAQGMIQKNRFHKVVFENTISVKFEDREFMLFSDFDEYLRNGYGDYMKLPPVEKRVAHHAYKAFWK